MPKPKANKLTIKRSTLMGIDRVQPHDPTILANALGEPNWTNVLDVVFAAASMHASERGIEAPDRSVGVLLELLAASAIGRPSNSMALLFDEGLYYFCTTKDIFGDGKSDGLSHRTRTSKTPPKAVRQGHLIKFAYRETNEEHVKLVIQTSTLFGTNG